jgi:hypothetical protein
MNIRMANPAIRDVDQNIASPSLAASEFERRKFCLRVLRVANPFVATAFVSAGIMVLLLLIDRSDYF